jgi:cytidylate kinase
MAASMIARPAKVIAVDGPSGSGKSSISRKSAEILDFDFLDTGAMYRSVTWFCQNKNLLDENDCMEQLNSNFSLTISINPKNDRVQVNNVDISHEIRMENITSKVSQYAALPSIRSYLVKQQRDIVANSVKGIVVEGRDIGSVVLPDADVKIFITASEEQRAKRRSKQNNQPAADVLVAQRVRDEKDSKRTVSPLVIPEGALILDNSELDFDQSVAKFIELSGHNK